MNKFKISLRYGGLFAHCEYSLYRDVRIANLQYGKINFDNVGNAFLTVFQCLTLEGWTSVMYNFQDSYGKYLATIYFVAFVLMCALLFLNVIVAVLSENYESSSNAEGDRDMLELDTRAQKLGIQKDIRDIIITQDIVVDSHMKTSSKEM